MVEIEIDPIQRCVGSFFLIMGGYHISVIYALSVLQLGSSFAKRMLNLNIQISHKMDTHKFNNFNK